MKTNINNLLTTAYELEGLLLVMQRHSGDVPQEVIDRFKEKAEMMAREAKLIERKEEECALSSQPLQQPYAPEDKPQQPALEEKPQPPVLQDKPQPPIVEEKPKLTISTPPPFKGTHDITSAFSINDRFLFQRELFDDDAEKFNDTIAQMQRMRDIDQVQQFMTDVLQWNTSDDVVKEFVRLINKSFEDNA